MRKGSLHGLLWTGLAAGLLITAYLLISTTFMFYDDEGYVLYTVRSYLAGHRLYDEVFSQYGPWPYVYHQLITGVLQHPLTHTLGRVLTSFHWMAAVLLAGLLAQRLTGRISQGIATAIIAFGLLWQMSAEPTHPGSMISVLVALAVVCGTRLQCSRRGLAAAGIVGALAALLCLTKINVGLLLITGAGCAGLRFTAWPGRWRTVADITAAVGLLAVPWVLMAKRLNDPWALAFAYHFTVGAGALLWVTPGSWTDRPLPPRAMMMAVVGFAAAGLSVCATVWAQGSSPAAMLEAVLITPLRQPGNFSFGFTWVSSVWPVAVAAWLLTAVAGVEMRRHGGVSPPIRGLLIAARLAALFVFVFHAQTWLTIYGVGRFIVFCLPLLPVFLVPLRSREQAAGIGAPRAVAWCAIFFALPQVLHAFPVAGSQMGWGTFLLVPFFVAGLHEAWASLEEFTTPARRWLVPAGTAALLAVSSYQLWLLTSNGWERYRTSRPLNLPGAEDIRLDGPARLTLRLLTLNATVHADLLFSRPGMFSYNIWSGVPTPTLQNATHWFWLLDETEQNRIVHRLQTVRRSAVITNRLLDEFMTRIAVSTAGPLKSYIEEAYKPLFRHKDFTFLVPCGSPAVPFGKIELRGKQQADPDGHLAVLWQCNLALNGRPVNVRLERSSYAWGVLHDFVRTGARIYVEPINSAGQVYGPALELPLNQPVQGLYRLSIFGRDIPRMAEPGDAVLLITDPDGRVLGEAIL